ncbi:MAG: HEAT repeat domain-containing protein [Chitinophagales bacterium]
MKQLSKVCFYLLLLFCYQSVMVAKPQREVLGINSRDVALDGKKNITSDLDEKLVLYYIYLTTASFAGLSCILVSITCIRRVVDNKRQKKVNLLIDKYQSYLAELVSDDYEDDMLKMLDSSEEQNLALSLLDISKPLHRKLLLEEMLSMQRYIAGKSASKIRELYLTLGFKEESLKQLKSRHWETVVRGISALSSMDIIDAYPIIFELVSHKHLKINEAAMVAHIQLSTDPLAFLDNYKGLLTEWHQYRMHSALSKLPMEEIPIFDRWMDNPNESVVEFVIKMSGLFQQAELAPKLARFLQDDSQAIQLASIKALAIVGTEEAVEPLINAFKQTKDNQFKIEIIKTLETLTSDEDLSFFEQQFTIKNYDIQLAIARAMNVIGEKSAQRLEELKGESGEDIQLLIKHAQKTY